MADTCPLHSIAGISRFNARFANSPSADEIAELGASIVQHGIIEPLILRVEDNAIRVLDGGRRYLAMKQLVQVAQLAPNFAVPRILFEGDDEQALEVSMISFLHRTDLHPVDEFERFAELRDNFGLDEVAIARKTGKSLRFVKDRLRLARLAPAIRDAWRDGKIIAEQARAFATNEHHDEQSHVFEQLLAEYDGDLSGTNLDPRRIIEALSDDALRDTHPLALFVGAEAYAAAGGELDAQLFEAETWFLNGALLRRLAEEKLEVLGGEIAATESWGWVCYDHKDANKWKDSFGGIEAGEGEYTDEETARLDEIESLPPNERNEHLDEIDQIEARAALRSIPAEDRRALGIYLSLDFKGRPEVIRGIRYDAPEENEAADAGDDDGNASTRARARDGSPASGRRSASEDDDAPAPRLASSEEMSAAARAVLDRAVNAALHEVVTRNLTLAMIIAVAKLASGYGGAIIAFAGGSWRNRDDRSALGRELSALGFKDAIHRAASVHGADSSAIPIALAEALAGVIDVSRSSSFDEALAVLTVAASMSDVAAELTAALDYDALFKVTPRETALAALREIDGDAAANKAAKLKKPELIKLVALLAKDKGWLPEPLRSAVAAKPKDMRSTAGAMLDAIEADEAAPGEAEETLAARDERLVAINYSAPVFASFLRDHVDWGENHEVKATDLREAYHAMSFTSARLNPGQIGALLKKIGVSKETRPDGTYYLGLAPKTQARARQAAE